ncbi:MAG: hypothetical protein LBU42_03455 [Prevotellaceae bacterium]|jgi:uncharacterized protein (TIGR02145 family)|nr:hypothetical protein [Prevotellaceae bacterium]
MKKLFFLFAMLASIAASAQVTNVEPLGANYTDKTVSFRVWWNAGSRDATHLSKVWVWVDYITVNSNNTTSGNSWTRATTETVSGGVTSYDGSHRNGFWLEGNASTNYSATLTVQLTNVPAKFNWCAYVSDYPPNVTANNGIYTFHGTPPFTLTAADGATQTVAGTTLTTSALTITPITIRDKTACPGEFCHYQGNDLYIDATHLCQQRASGAQNWEAWIKDARDNELYRIVLMPDELWWTAEEMRYDASATKQSYKCPTGAQRTIYNRPNIACPVGWILPSVAQFTYLHNIASEIELLAANTYAVYGTGIDHYGFSVIPDPGRADDANDAMPKTCLNDYSAYPAAWDTLNERRMHCMHRVANTKPCFAYDLSWNQVRCIRNL